MGSQSLMFIDKKLKNRVIFTLTGWLMTNSTPIEIMVSQMLLQDLMKWSTSGNILKNLSIAYCGNIPPKKWTCYRKYPSN